MISSMGGYRCCHIQFWNMVIMEKEKRYVASISGGKDSMAMVLGLMEKGWPLTHCVYFDTGMEFSCIRKNIEKLFKIIAYLDMTPAEFFAPLDDEDTTYRKVCEKLRTMNESDIEKINTFIGWIEK